MFRKKRSLNDAKIVQIIQKQLSDDGYDNFELESIISLERPPITSVIVHTNHQEFCMEINYKTSEILSKEKIAKQ